MDAGLGDFKITGNQAELLYRTVRKALEINWHWGIAHIGATILACVKRTI
jgi:hypothetical protein